MNTTAPSTQWFQPAFPAAPAPEPQRRAFRAGLFTDGTLELTVGSKRLRLDRVEAEKLADLLLKGLS